MARMKLHDATYRHLGRNEETQEETKEHHLRICVTHFVNAKVDAQQASLQERSPPQVLIRSVLRPTPSVSAAMMI